MEINKLRRLLIENKVEVWRGGKIAQSFLKKNENFRGVVGGFRERFSHIFANDGEVLCWLISGLKIKKCVVCGKRIAYSKMKQGRDVTFCSRSCAMTDEGKRITYEKSKKSLVDKTGMRNNFQIHKERIKEKTRATRFARAYSEVKRKLAENNLEVVGDISSFFDEEGKRNRFKIRCEKCGTVFEREIRKGNDFGMFCPHCNHLGMSWSAGERELGRYIQGLIGEENVILNTRRVIKGVELDIFVPEKNIAIEYNGLYWHSDFNGKDANYHLEKTINCSDAGIRLIHVFEDEWRFKRKIVETRLKHILGLVKKKIYARKCEVSSVGNKLANTFQEKYHLQGAVPASVKLGLFYKGRLVALMTFAKPRFRKDYNWELVRYCTIGSFNVVGGASKLLSAFRNRYEGSIISYADKRWSDGNLYKKLGFLRKVDTLPTASYFHKDKGYRENYVRFLKHKQNKVLKIFDPDKSTHENMRANGYGRVWDCGNFVFVLTEEQG